VCLTLPAYVDTTKSCALPLKICPSSIPVTLSLISRTKSSVGSLDSSKLYTYVMRALQERYKSVTRVLQECYKSVTRLLQECYKSATKVLQEYYKSVTGVLPEYVCAINTSKLPSSRPTTISCTPSPVRSTECMVDTPDFLPVCTVLRSSTCVCS
jgi:hypothetical protein